MAQQLLAQPVAGPRRPPTCERRDWGPAAKEVYFEFSRRMDSLEDTNQQRYELGMRACENTARLATIVAVGRGSMTVGQEDIDWAIKLAERSFEAACGGVDKYMREYFEFPKFCQRVLDKLVEHEGWRSKRDLERDFRSNKKYGPELEKVINQLKAEELIKSEARSASRGPASPGYRLKEE